MAFIKCDFLYLSRGFLYYGLLEAPFLKVNLISYE